MKEIHQSVTIQGMTAQTYWTTVYAEADAFDRYHREYTKDPDAATSPWVDGRRTVAFRMAINMPQIVKRAIGVDSISVVEMQVLEWCGKDCFSVESQPSLNFPGSDKFVTKAMVTVRTTDAGGSPACEVAVVMSCSASMPWPMQSTIEAAMVVEAEAGLRRFLGFCSRLCEEAVANAVPVHVAPTPPATPPQPPQRTAAEDDLFFDAAEQVEAGAGGGDGGEWVVTASPRGTHTPADALLAAVRELQQSSKAANAALAQVAAQLQALTEAVTVIRSVVAPGSLSSVPAPAWQTKLKPLQHAGQPAPAPWASSATSARAGWFVAGACVSAAALYFLRSRAVSAQRAS